MKRRNYYRGGCRYWSCNCRQCKPRGRWQKRRIHKNARRTGKREAVMS